MRDKRISIYPPLVSIRTLILRTHNLADNGYIPARLQKNIFNWAPINIVISYPGPVLVRLVVDESLYVHDYDKDIYNECLPKNSNTRSEKYFAFVNGK